MRETRLYGSEGGGAGRSPYPYQAHYFPIRPLFGFCDQPRTDWVVKNVLPFLLRRFSRPQQTVKTSLLPLPTGSNLLIKPPLEPLRER